MAGSAHKPDAATSTRFRWKVGDFVGRWVSVRLGSWIEGPLPGSVWRKSSGHIMTLCPVCSKPVFTGFVVHDRATLSIASCTMTGRECGHTFTKSFSWPV